MLGEGKKERKMGRPGCLVAKPVFGGRVYLLYPFLSSYIHALRDEGEV